jgi:hypothetical protein
MAIDLSGMASPGVAAAPMAAPNSPAAAPVATTADVLPGVTPPPVQEPGAPNVPGPASALPEGTSTAVGDALTTQPTPPKGGTPVGTPNPGPHARLLAMVKGLALGMDAFASSAATGGREGGVQEVQAVRAQQQEQQIRAQQAAQAQKNAQLQNQLMQGQITQLQYANHANLATLPDKIQQSHLETQKLGTEVATGRLGLLMSGGLNEQQIGDLMAGKADAGTSDVLLSSAERNARITAESHVLPPDNPSVVRLNNALDHPENVAELIRANNGLTAEMQGHEKVFTDAIKQAEAKEAQPIGRTEATNQNQLLLNRYKIMHPEAKELPAGMGVTATSTWKDAKRQHDDMKDTENAAGIQESRAITEQMRQLQLKQLGGAVPGDVSKTGPEYLATLPPGDQAVVKEIGEGRGAPPQPGNRSPRSQTLNAELNLAYPHYDSSKYPAYVDLRKKFAGGGQIGTAINSYNTVADHLQKMYDNAQTLVGMFPGTRTAAEHLQSPQANKLAEDREAIATELSKAMANGQISEGEVNNWKKNLTGWSPGELKLKIGEVASLLQGKLDAYKHQWSVGAPAPEIVPPLEIVSPHAQAALDHVSEKGGPAQSVGHKVGDQIHQGGKIFTVTSVDANGKVTGAN